jgi:hypothetical protein
MRLKREEKLIFNFWILLCFLMMLVPIGSAFNITTDSISQTSITWNISEMTVLNETVIQVALDGVELNTYADTSIRVVQSNLKPNEQHIISVETDVGISEATATTLQEPMNEENGLFTTINLYILVLLALIFVVCAIFTGIYFLAFIGTLFSFIGIVGSIGNNFITGLIFIIMFIVTLIVGFNT